MYSKHPESGYSTWFTWTPPGVQVESMWMLYNNLAGLQPTKIHPESTGVQVNYVGHCKVLLNYNIIYTIIFENI